MDCHSSATARSEAPHATETDSTKTISDALKRRARSVINDRSIDPESRALVRYALEINDPCLADLVRRADAGETIVAALERSEISESNGEDWSEERIELLAEIICRAGNEPDTKSAALFVLMGAIENSNDPKLLANTAKHFAFSRCGESCDSKPMIAPKWKSPASRECLVSLGLEILHNPRQSVPEAIERGKLRNTFCRTLCFPPPASLLARLD